MNTLEAPELRQTTCAIIKNHKLSKTYGKTISQVTSSCWYVRYDEEIERLAVELQRNESIKVLAVVDHELKPLGIIRREKMFDKLARHYGRDVLRHHPVEEIAEQAGTHFFDRNILSIFYEIESKISSFEASYFLLVSHDGKYEGVFSSIDLLNYMSTLTKDDLALAKKLQTGIISSSELVRNKNIHIMCGLSMAKIVGGDFYYIKQTGPGKWIVALCDVSGKGITASLVTSFVAGMFHLYDPSASLSDFITKLNNIFIAIFNHEKFVTGVFLELDEKTGVCTLYDMGHSFVYCMENRKISKLVTPGDNMPIGVKPDICPLPYTITLKEKDTLIFVTDGMLEQVNSQGKKYSLKRAAAIIDNLAAEKPELVKETLFFDFFTYRENQPQFDDASFLALYYKGR